jgi:hypothetical protein
LNNYILQYTVEVHLFVQIVWTMWKHKDSHKKKNTYKWPQKEASDCNQSETLSPSSLSLSRPLCASLSITTYSNTSYSSCKIIQWCKSVSKTLQLQTLFNYSSWRVYNCPRLSFIYSTTQYLKRLALERHREIVWYQKALQSPGLIHPKTRHSPTESANERKFKNAQNSNIFSATATATTWGYYTILKRVQCTVKTILFDTDVDTYLCEIFEGVHNWRDHVLISLNLSRGTTLADK